MEIDLNILGLNDFTIELFETKSFVSSKPINEEIIKGAINRNNNLLKMAQDNKTNYDLLISVEGGYEQIGEYYFIVSYACIYDIYGNRFIGKSQGLQISKKCLNG